MSSWKQDDYVDASEAWRRPNDDYEMHQDHGESLVMYEV